MIYSKKDINLKLNHQTSSKSQIGVFAKDRNFPQSFSSPTSTSGVWKVLISQPLHKSLLPRTLRPVLRKMRIKLAMSRSINFVISRWAVSISLISIIESVLSVRIYRDEIAVCLLVSSIVVRWSCRSDEVRCCWLPNARVQKRCDDRDIQDISGEDECPRSSGRKLTKAQDGLLCCNEGADCVDVQISCEVC